MEPTRGGAGREAAEGAARGTLFMSLFGAVWALSGAEALGGAAGALLGVVLCALAVVLCVGAVRLGRRGRGLPRDESPRARAVQTRLSRRFGLVFGLEGVAIALAVVALGRLGLGAYLPAVVALIVGVHFFPLATLYGIRAYGVTGAALCVLALVAFPLPPPARLPFVGLGSAATLFATAAYALSLGGRATRSGPGAPAA